MTDPFGLMKFAECEHKQLKCEKCGARSDIRGWSTFTGQNKEMMDLREANESLTARLAEAEAERDKYQKLNDIRWKESVMMTSEIGSLERRIAASELRCEKFQSQQAICQCGEPFSSHSEGSSCGMAVENQPPCPCQQRLAEAEARLRKYEPEPGKCEHGVAEGDWCEPCNREYKEAAKGGRDEC